MSFESLARCRGRAGSPEPRKQPRGATSSRCFAGLFYWLLLAGPFATVLPGQELAEVWRATYVSERGGEDHLVGSFVDAQGRTTLVATAHPGGSSLEPFDHFDVPTVLLVVQLDSSGRELWRRQLGEGEDLRVHDARMLADDSLEILVEMTTDSLCRVVVLGLDDDGHAVSTDELSGDTPCESLYRSSYRFLTTTSGDVRVLLRRQASPLAILGVVADRWTRLFELDTQIREHFVRLSPDGAIWAVRERRSAPFELLRYSSASEGAETFALELEGVVTDLLVDGEGNAVVVEGQHQQTVVQKVAPDGTTVWSLTLDLRAETATLAADGSLILPAVDREYDADGIVLDERNLILAVSREGEVRWEVDGPEDVDFFSSQSSVQPTGDGGAYVVFNAPDVPAGGALLIDPDGQVRWSLPIHVDGAFWWFNHLAITPRGELLLSGTTFATHLLKGGIEADLITVRLDAKGDEEWRSRLDSSGVGGTALALGVDEGGFVYTAGVHAGGGAMALKYDDSASELWRVEFRPPEVAFSQPEFARSRQGATAVAYRDALRALSSEGEVLFEREGGADVSGLAWGPDERLYAVQAARLLA